MKILGIGIDIVENKRLHNQKIIERFLNTREFNFYKNIINKKEAFNFASGRWAAKEAIIKATDKKISFDKIEILNDDSGKPLVYIDQILSTDFHLSISHESNYTVAFTIWVK